MLRPVGNFVKQCGKGVYGECRSALSTIRTKGPGQLTFWLLALVIGVAAGAAALGFRVAISEIQSLLYGADDKTLATTLGSLDWKWVLGIPILGGLAVGLILSKFTPDGQARAVSDVTDGAAMREGRVSQRIGLASAAAAHWLVLRHCSSYCRPSNRWSFLLSMQPVLQWHLRLRYKSQ